MLDLKDVEHRDNPETAHTFGADGLIVSSHAPRMSDKGGAGFAFRVYVSAARLKRHQMPMSSKTRLAI